MAKMRKKSTLTPAWTKLSLACHSQSHLITALRPHLGGAHDCPDFIPLLRTSETLIHFGRVLADKAYDSERNHQVAREKLGIRSTIIPPYRRGLEKCWHKRGKKRVGWWGHYRQQLRRHFPSRKYRNRSQVECVISRFKRLLGPAQKARKPSSKISECYQWGITYNVCILATWKQAHS